MGGLASIIASSTDRRFTAVSPFASVNADADMVRKIEAPLLLISGSEDILCSAYSIREMYKVTHPLKILSEVMGGWHCGFMDISVPLPDFLCRPIEGWLYREQILELTRCLLTPFFNLYLKGNTSGTSYIFGPDIFEYKLMEVMEDVGFTLLPSNQTEHFSHGQQAKFIVSLHNSEKMTNTFYMKVMDSSVPTVVKPSSVTLLPGQSQQISILFNIPKDLAADSYSVTVDAISQIDNKTRQSCQVFAKLW